MNGAEMDSPNTPNLPYRLAIELQNRIISEVETSDYYVGRAEREDMAYDMTMDSINSWPFTEPDIAFSALQHWRSIYGGIRHHG